MLPALLGKIADLADSPEIPGYPAALLE